MKKIYTFFTDLIYIISAIFYKLIHPYKDIIILYPDRGNWRVINLNTGDQMIYPSPHGIFRIVNIKNDSKRKKYELDNFVEIEENDVVVDIGAFVGEFSVCVENSAARIIACEPSPQSVQSLQKNTKNHSTIEPISVLISDNNTIEKLKIGEDQSENSILNIDSGEFNQDRVGVVSLRIDKLCEFLEINKIDFLKVEGEGTEPEILKGISNTYIEKIAVDAGAERYGETTIDEVKFILEEKGYTIKERNNVVFARINQST